MRQIRFTVLRAAILGALTLVSLVGAASAGAATPNVTPGERVRALVEPSIVYIATEFSGLVYDNVNKQLVRSKPFTRQSSCSGFFVSPQGDVVTAAHCVESSQRVKDDLRANAAAWALQTGYYGNQRPRADSVFRSYGVRGLQRTVVVAYGVSASADTQSGTARRALLKGIRSASQQAGDVALLKMLNVQDVPALKVAGDEQVETLEDVWSVGYPAKIDYAVDDTFAPSFKDGSISSQKTQADVPVYELSSAMAPGMSGGPTVDAEGNVIGVNSFIALDQVGENVTRSEAFTFVQTAATINDLLADKSIDAEFGETNTIYRDGINAYVNGDRSEAIDKLEEVLVRVPNHTLAREYLAKSEALPEDSGGMPGWVWILIALAVIGAVAAGIYALLRSGRIKVGRRTKPAVEPSSSAPAPARGRTTISPRPGEASLVIQQGPGAGQRFAITSDMLLGREEADINLDDPEVSRRHAMIRRVNGSLEISDLRSANGTRINGSPIDGPRPVTDGDTIEIGKTTLSVELSASGGRPKGETASSRRSEDN
jgi:serine protease Do